MPQAPEDMPPAGFETSVFTAKSRPASLAGRPLARGPGGRFYSTGTDSAGGAFASAAPASAAASVSPAASSPLTAASP